ncbi:MAG: NAD(P)H-dependent glycerol-3-phosphate dehydrogenase, partial [Planctomycetota bacterium]
MRVGVVGAGAWGTTIAIHLAKKGAQVQLWARDPERAAKLQRERVNERYLPDFPFPDGVRVLSGRLDPCDFLVGAVPTQHVRAVFATLADLLPRAPLLSVAKGIEVGTCLLPTQILARVLGDAWPTAVLTGPCIALEVARGMPTAVVVAGAEARRFQDAFSTSRFRVYTSDDKMGLELAAGLK